MRVASPLRRPTLAAFTLLGSLSMGCSQAKLVETGGAGLLYCFAID